VIHTWYFFHSVMTCKGICIKHKAIKPYGTNRYHAGQKRCSICAIFMNWDGKHCPCCNFMLRTIPRNTKNRHQLQLIYAPKRI